MSKWRRWCYAWRRVAIAHAVTRDWTAPSLGALEDVVHVNEVWAATRPRYPRAN